MVGLALGVLPVVAGCQSGGRAVGPARAIWVTRFDYKTPDDVVRVMDNCQSAGFNTVLFQVRGNGTVSYPSKIEPWAEQYDFRDPGYDPLAVAVREAHRRGMQLHAWVNVMPAWRGAGPPPVANQLYRTHPDWFWYDVAGRRQPLNHAGGGRSRDWYVSLNPCLPEVRKYLVSVLHELAGRYDLDGLHLDYIRFPNEAVVPGEQIPDYPRDARTLALFKQDTGKTPDQDPAEWNRWRTFQVSRLVADIHDMLRKTRPGAMLSASVGVDPRSALTHFQNPRDWMSHNVIDAVYLMNYTSDPARFNENIKPWLAAPGRARVVPGLSIPTSVDPAQCATIARREIDLARTATGRFSVFAYSLLFDSTNTEFDAQNTAASRARAARRQALIPYLRSLAEDQPYRVASK